MGWLWGSSDASKQAVTAPATPVAPPASAPAAAGEPAAADKPKKKICCSCPDTKVGLVQAVGGRCMLFAP